MSFKERVSRIIFFFPLQLFWVQLKKNQTILIFWLILFAYVTRTLSVKYGIPHLFLYPEYLGEVNMLSHIMLGFSCGVYIMAYNISTYIINGYRFPFIATLSRPFLKFCYNNSLIPWLFTFAYIWNMVDYQRYTELVPTDQIIYHVAGYLVGNVLFIAFSMGYFLTTNKSAVNLGFQSKKSKQKKNKTTVRDFLHRPGRWDKILNRESRWKIETYLSTPFRISLARSSEHYEQDTLRRVFSQNHLNASFFEIMCIVAILLVGWFKENPWFVIPAGSSMFLLFGIILMITSAIHSWVKGWSFTIFIAIFIGLHFASKYELISFSNHAYGLDYNGSKANYHEEFLLEMARDKYSKEEDKKNGIKILENWKAKQDVTPGKKPKLLIVNTSGGGLRSMMWTTLSMLRLNDAMDDNFFRHLHLITGSSGGMIGASYVRELYLNDLQPDDFEKEVDFLAEKISRDVLNPVTLSLVTSDLFYKYQTFEDGPYTYYKDRAYAFEKTLNENVGHLFDKRLRDYTQYEQNADIPMMIFTPTIINDGRRLIISAQPMSYMMNNIPTANVNAEPILENIEFQRFFSEQDATNIRFTSILRMNATFPYILPAAALPSEPEIRVMDAGIRDNYGLTTSIKYIYNFRDWISENTSGVVILQLRDKFKRYEAKSRTTQSLLSNLTSPLDNFYSNWTNIQTFEQDQMLQYASSWFDGKIDVVSFQLKNDPTQRISLSWHLTNTEKMRIKGSLYIPENQAVLDHLRRLLDE